MAGEELLHFAALAAFGFQLFKETRQFPPSREFAAQAHIKSLADYEKLYERADKDPEGFWADAAKAIRFGDEGQHWQMMDISEFLAHPLAVPDLKLRLQIWLNELDPE